MQALRLAEERGRLLASAEGQLFDLAFAVASAVLGRWAGSQREAVMEAARLALAEAIGASQVVVRAHPLDAATLVEGLRGEARLAARVVADDGVERGGVVVETEAGRIEATVSSQLAALRRAALGEGGA